MATSKGQRIGIWVIAVVLTVGTVGGFLTMVLAQQNTAGDNARLAQLESQYQKDYAAYQEKVEAQSAQLSEKYYPEFSQYASRAGTFDGSNVSELGKEDLKEGTGKTVEAGKTFVAYYIGWTADGKVFDQSLDGEKLKAPITVENGTGVISGWTEGVVGMKEGGVRELTIPAKLAYGEEATEGSELSGKPLKFVIMVIEQPEKLTQPTMPKELMEKYYGQQQLQ